jgi:hypothetical protein
MQAGYNESHRIGFIRFKGIFKKTKKGLFQLFSVFIRNFYFIHVSDYIHVNLYFGRNKLGDSGKGIKNNEQIYRTIKNRDIM